MSLLIGEIFRRNAEVVPSRTAAAMGDESISFGELDAAGNRLARFLAKSGVGKGDRPKLNAVILQLLMKMQ